MKHIIIFISLFPLFTKAQDCPLHKETDPYTRETKLSTGFIALSGASVTVDADSKEIDVFFTVPGTDRCYDNNSTAAVFFEGSKVKLNYRNGGSMNCEGFFHLNFRNTATTNSLLQRLVSLKVASILFSTGDKKKDATIKLSPEQQESFMKLGNCLVNEAKSLIK